MDAHTAQTAATSHSGYFEVTPQEFGRMAHMVVVVLKAPHALGAFDGHRHVIAAADAREAWDVLRALPTDQPVGVVCPDGECSSRLATRLARYGHAVYHLSGGLREWYHCCGRSTLPA